MKSSLRASAVWLFMLLVLHSSAFSQGYPSRTIQIVVGFPPGGSVDLVARIVANGFSTEYGQAVVVENKAGASGTIAANQVARSNPDGYTLLLVPGGHALYGATFKTLPFEPVASFAWIGNIVTIPFFIAVSARSDLKSLSALISKAKADPEKLKFGTVGPGSPHHLGVELLSMATGAKFLHVPYRGEGPLVAALIASEIDFAILTPTSVLGNVQSGTLRALAVATKARSARLSDVATVEQSLNIQDFDVGSWFALAAAAGTPQPVIDLLNSTLRKILQSPDSIGRLAAVGGEIAASTPDQQRDRVIREGEMWRRIVETAGVPKQ